MTYEDLLEEMCMDCTSYPCKALKNKDYCYSYTEIKELIDNRNKHQWHNLRKNPNDLPDEDESFKLVYVVHRYDHDDGYYDYDMAFTYNDGFENRWIFKSAKTHDFYEVIAWKNIELFEVKK